MTEQATIPEARQPRVTPGVGAPFNSVSSSDAESAGAASRRSIDRSASPGRSGSIMLVLLIAALLVGAAAGIVLVGGSNAEPYILAFLAVLATAGVFSLFALASGILRISGGT